MRDVTERKKVQEALRLSEERFRDLAELLPETVYEADLDGRLTFVNKSGLERFGYREADIVQGLQMRDVIARDDLPGMEVSLGRCSRAKRQGSWNIPWYAKTGVPFPACALGTHPAWRGCCGHPRLRRGHFGQKESRSPLLNAQRM